MKEMIDFAAAVVVVVVDSLTEMWANSKVVVAGFESSPAAAGTTKRNPQRKRKRWIQI